MSVNIHPQAVVESGAVLGEDVVIGAFCYVGEGVKLGDGAKLFSHVCLMGDTEIGKNCKIFPFASVGSEPQDLKYKGETSKLIIGDNCLIREGVTINGGTDGGGNITRIGNHCVFLANSHVAHDCQVGDFVIASNGTLIAGHCKIENHVIFGGASAIHQHSRVGCHAFIGGAAAVEGDVLPFAMAIGNRANLIGINIVGLKRAKFSLEDIRCLREVYKLLFDGTAPLRQRAENLRATQKNSHVIEMLDFIGNDSQRAFCVPINVVDKKQ